MEPNIDVRPSQHRTWWFRGGEWAVKLSLEGINHIDHSAPEDGTEIGDGDIWLCVNVDGSFYLERDFEYWEKHLLTDLDSRDLANVVDEDRQIYRPLEDEPELYLRFASLGRLSWDLTGERYLSDYAIEDEDHESFLPQDLQQAIVEFHVRYGPPYQLYEFVYKAEPYTTTVHSMLRQAQLIDMMMEYQRVNLGETGIRRLQNQIISIRDAHQPEVRDRNETSYFNWARSRVLYSKLSEESQTIPQHLRRDRLDQWLAENPEPPPEAINEYDRFDLTTATGVFGAVQKCIMDESTRPYALGGLRINVDLFANPSPPGTSAWRFTFRFDHLMNVIWYQAFQATMRGVLLRTCPSDNCDKPGGLFVAARPNQVYCSTKCRNYHNVQAHRRRNSKRDLLP